MVENTFNFYDFINQDQDNRNDMLYQLFPHFAEVKTHIFLSSESSFKYLLLSSSALLTKLEVPFLAVLIKLMPFVSCLTICCLRNFSAFSGYAFVWALLYS